MGMKVKRTGLALGGALVATTPVLAACQAGPTYDQWAATDGAAGRINLDEVQDAFKKSESPTEFERKVNEIYEGDSLVLVRARQDPDALVLEGWEDLNNNFEIDETVDDKLFDIVNRNKQQEMRGYGSNGYYNRGFGGGDFLFTYLLISSLSPRGYYYSTPPTRARGTLSRQRANYRSSPGYRTQVSRNSRYFRQQKNFAGSRYNQPAGTARQSYMSKQQSSGAFKNSRTGVRSSWGSGGSGSRFGRSGSRFGGGGFRGGGGAQVVIGVDRRV